MNESIDATGGSGDLGVDLDGLAQSWRDSPASGEPRRNLRPRVASRSKWARIDSLLRNRAFTMEYASARERWRDGVPAVFPAGTYWLQRFASVPVFET